MEGLKKVREAYSKIRNQKMFYPEGLKKVCLFDFTGEKKKKKKLMNTNIQVQVQVRGRHLK